MIEVAEASGKGSEGENGRGEAISLEVAGVGWHIDKNSRTARSIEKARGPRSLPRSPSR